jgi:hypothetical protein
MNGAILPSGMTTGHRDGEAQVRVSAALVVGLSVVHLVMAYYVRSLPDAVFDLVEPFAGQEPALMMVSLTPALPLALVVLRWAHERLLGWIACLVVAATALLPYVRGVVDRRLVEAGDAHAAASWADWSGWGLLVLLPVGAALGWGISRRRDTRWWPGLLVAAAVAGLFRSLDLDAFPDDAGLRAGYLALVYHVVPALLAGLTCWRLDTQRPPA